MMPQLSMQKVVALARLTSSEGRLDTQKRSMRPKRKICIAKCSRLSNRGKQRLALRLLQSEKKTTLMRAILDLTGECQQLKIVAGLKVASTTSKLIAAKMTSLRSVQM